MGRRRVHRGDEWDVRVFVDHAETPVWYHGPRDHDEMCLSPDLERDLRAFDDWHYRIEDPRDFYAVRADVRAAYEREGERLAQALAVELGQPFIVTVLHPDHGSGRRTYRSTSAPTNPEAHDAFVRIHDEDR